MSFVETINIANAAGTVINPATEDAQTDGSQKTQILAENGESVSVQNPLQVDGDSIHAVDLDLTNSSIGTFDGVVADLESLFDDYTNEIEDADATNPKSFTLRFKRPLASNKIGIGSLTGNFSNVKIELKDLAGTVRTTIDDSANNTDYTSNVYSFPTNVFIEAVVTFATADVVNISGMYIPKSQAINISAIDGYVSETNSTVTPLNAGVVFTGTMVDTLNYGMVVLAIKSDQVSATDGLSVQFSTDGTNWDHTDEFTIAAATGKTFSFQTAARFLRVVYTNGGVNQTYFRMQTTLKPVYVKPSSHRMADNVSGQDDAELVKAGLTGERDDGVFGNVKLDNQDNLRINSFPYTYSISEGVITGHDPLLKFGTRTAVAQNVLSTIWEGPTALYAYLPSAEQLQVTSTDNVADNIGGTGALTLVLEGLDASYNEITETVIMTGTTAATTTASFIRIFRGYVETCGTGLTNAGTISVQNNASTVTQLIINIGDGQTLMALWTVPLGKTAFVTNGSFSTNSNRGSTISLFVRQVDGGTLYPWLIKYRAYTFSGNSNFPFTIPFKIPAKSDIEVRVITPNAAGVTSGGATFELWYEDD